jgi:hypothetical protein
MTVAAPARSIVKFGRVFEFRPYVRIVTGDDLRAGTPGNLVQFADRADGVDDASPMFMGPGGAFDRVSARVPCNLAQVPPDATPHRRRFLTQSISAIRWDQEHRDLHPVPDAPGDAAQKDVAKQPVSMRGHGDQIAPDIAGETDDLVRRLATSQVG